jgi:hypothetical protein
VATKTQCVHSGPAPWLRPVLEQWCDVVFDFCRAFKWEDVPWWYGERSAVGLFAAALTRAGWVVLEEFSTEKVGDASSLPGMKGRQDLLAVKGDEGFVAEAKNNWTRVPRRSGDLKTFLCRLLDHATCDAMAKEPYDYKQAAVVFSSPKVHRSDDAPAATREWCKAIDDLDDCARAWLLPRRAARFPEGTDSDDKTAGWGAFVFPGTAVIVRECSPRRRRV